MMAKRKNLKHQQAGFTVIEAMIVIALALGALSLVLTNKSKADASSTAKDAVTSLSTMTTKIHGFFAPTNSYNAMTASVVNGMSVVTQPLTWDGSNVRDASGNVMQFVGNAAAAGTAASYAVTYGGATNPLDKETCTTIATGMVAGADVMRVGANSSMTTTNGLAGGGSVYKSAVGATPDIVALTTGCSAANPTIVMQFH